MATPTSAALAAAGLAATAEANRLAEASPPLPLRTALRGQLPQLEQEQQKPGASWEGGGKRKVG